MAVPSERGLLLLLPPAPPLLPTAPLSLLLLLLCLPSPSPGYHMERSQKLDIIEALLGGDDREPAGININFGAAPSQGYPNSHPADNLGVPGLLL